jgi:3-oxoacyl-ACP reductase-like protein
MPENEENPASNEEPQASEAKSSDEAPKTTGKPKKSKASAGSASYEKKYNRLLKKVKALHKWSSSGLKIKLDAILEEED